MNGIELYRRIQKSFTSLPVILMTAYAHTELIEEGIDEGIENVLTKPLDIDALLEILHAYARKMTDNQAE